MKRLLQSQNLFGDASRYALSGLGAAATDFAIYGALHLGLGWAPVHANLISRPVGGLASFMFHKYFTFQNRGTARTTTQFVRFWGVWILSFLVSQSLIWYASRVLNLQGVLAKVIAEGAAALISFLCQRFWTFSRRPSGDAS